MSITLQTFDTLGDVDPSIILNEIDIGSGDKHLFLQDGYKHLFDAPYLNGLFDKYKMYNSRVMVLHPKECYSWHRDITPRVHFPLITNSKCLFILGDNAKIMPVGSAYWVDTRQLHTALNGNKKDFLRYHIVGMTDLE